MPPQGVAGDSLRRVLDSVFTRSGYAWVERSDPAEILYRWRNAVLAWLWDLDERHPTLFTLLIIALMIVLVAILVHVCWIFVRTLQNAVRAPALPGTRGGRRDEAWYRGEADRLAAKGRYVEAMQAEFLALVIALDAAQLLRFHPSKTPAEYLAEVRLPAGSRQEFRELVTSLYGFAFARWPIDAGSFGQWRQRAARERYAPAA